MITRSFGPPHERGSRRSNRSPNFGAALDTIGARRDLVVEGGVKADNDNGPRLLGRRDASAYCGIGESTFSLWVATHKMPPSVPGTRKWDKRAIDARLDEISGLGANDNETETSLQKWRRERDARRAKGSH